MEAPPLAPGLLHSPALEGRDAFFWAKKNVYYGIGSEEKNGPVIVSNSSICAQEKRYLLTDRKGAEKPVWIHMPT